MFLSIRIATCCSIPTHTNSPNLSRILGILPVRSILALQLHRSMMLTRLKSSLYLRCLRNASNAPP